MFAFTLSLDDFVSTLFTAGANSTTLPLRIYSLVKYGVTPELNAISTLLILVTLAALLAGHYLQRRAVSQRLVLGLGGGTAALVAVLLIVSIALADDRHTLNVYNYAGYFPDSILADFEKETGIRINYSYFNDNEELLSRLSLGACDYDLVVPSDYMVRTMIKLKLLARINRESLANYANLDERFTRMEFDPTGEYYIPYTYGCTGLLYNRELTQPPVDSWRVLWDERYKGRILMLDDMRECFGLAFRLLGGSLTDRDPRMLQDALALLRKQKPLVLRYDSNTVDSILLSREAYLAPYWSGGGLRLTKDHPEFEFAIPREGVPMFVDTFCIPRDARHKENAERLIDFMLRPDIAARCMEELLYPMPNTQAPALLPEDIHALLQPMLTLDLKKLQLVGELGEFNKDVDRAWTELRSR